jgi:hypothetical protein
MTESGQVFPAGAQSPHRAGIGGSNLRTEIIGFSGSNVSSSGSDETNLSSDETIFRFRADIRKQPLVISYP